MPGRVLCAACWERVPKEIQELVAETWRADSPSEAHRNAIKAAVRTVTLPLTD